MSDEKRLAPESLAAHYFPELPETAFGSAEEEREAWLRFLDMLCAAMLLYKEENGPEAAAFCSSLGAERELAAQLLPRRPAAFRCRAPFSAVLEGLLRRGEQTEAAGRSTPWETLLGLIQPDLTGLIGLLAAFAASCSRRYERVFGALQEQTQPMGLPTAGLAEDLARLLSDLPGGASPLLEPDSLTGSLVWLPAPAPSGFSRLCRPLSLHPRVYEYLTGAKGAPGALEEYAELLSPDADPGEPIGKPDPETVAGLAARLAGEGAILHLQGPAGCGRTFLAHCIGRRLGTPVLAVDAGLLLRLPPQQQREIAIDAARFCLLGNALLLLRRLDAQREDQAAARALLTLLHGCLPVVLVSSEAENPGCFPAGVQRCTVAVERPDRGQQPALWAALAARQELPLSPAIALEDLCSRFDLTPGQIRSVLADASARCASEGLSAIGMRELTDSVRTASRTDLGECATRLSAPFTWDDLKLDPKAEQDLRRACDRLRRRGTVNIAYGFDRKLPYGKGLSILLYGPPGTGKTMAAQVVANELELDLYRIDLAQISSKYIGETQKNLSAVFDNARYSNAILFFDEADALFAKRTDVSTSNDRYANAETAFLLQKVEEYPGVTILATNHTQNFDPAFRRRITFQINLVQPDAALRLRLWQSVFPPETPLEPGIEFDRLAERAELTGSGIKAAAVSAAYAAAASGGVVTMAMIRRAAVEELRKAGRLIEEYELY